MYEYDQRRRQQQQQPPYNPYFPNNHAPPRQQQQQGRHGPEAFRRPFYNPWRYHRNLPWKEQLIWFAAAALGLATWYGTPVSVWVTDLVLQQVPLAADYELGRQALQELPYRTVYSPQWTPLVTSVGKELVETLETKLPPQDDRFSTFSSLFSSSIYDPSAHQYHWDIAVIHADFINAFALPGGVIRVTDTLLQVLQPTRGELAALLGHEMGHVIHRHSQARVLQSQLLQWILQALVYDDEKDGVKNNKNRRPPRTTTKHTTAAAATARFGISLGHILTQSAWWFGQQRFSRRDEYQADAVSWDLLAASQRYTPQSLESLLQKLWSLEQDSTSGERRQGHQRRSDSSSAADASGRKGTKRGGASSSSSSSS